MVGQQLGQNRADLAARATWNALAVALLYMGSMALLYVLVPDWFLFGYAAGSSPKTFLPLRNLTIVLLRFVAAYCLFDALNMIFASAIKGAGDTRFVFLTTLVMSPPPVLATWWGIAYMGWGLTWCWTVITLWVCSLGLIYLARFLQGHWRQMRVIEPELLAAESVTVAKLEADGSLQEPGPFIHW
jgi:MATE family multidrug resistance protein